MKKISQKEVTKKSVSHWGELYLPLIIITVMRVGGYIYMYFDPFWGILLSFVFDFLDCVILYMFGVPYKGYYHRIDKRLDYLQYLFLLPLVWNHPVFLYVLAAFIYRSIGDLIVYFTGNRKFFFFFPNLTEYIFLIYLVIQRYNLPIEWNNTYLLLGLLGFKLIQETLIHVAPVGKGYLKEVTWLPQIHKWKE